MDSLIINQIKAFCDTNDRDACSQEVGQAIEKLKTLDWDNKENRKNLLEECVKELQNFTSAFFEFVEKLGKKSENQQLLNAFVWQDCSALLQLILSIQTGDIESRNLAMKRIIPMFFAFDRINYKRWSVIDLAIKTSVYPKDLNELFKKEGVWRGNMTENIGSFMSLDMLHECSFNAPLKSAIHKFRQSEEILENLSNWLVFRGQFCNEWKRFFHPGVHWIRRDDENHENSQEIRRYNVRMTTLQEIYKEKIVLTYDMLEDPDFHEELTSFSAQKISNKDILNCYEIGQQQFQSYVEERIIQRTVGLFDPIKKTNVEVFPMTEEKKKAKRKTKSEGLELRNQSKVV